MYTEFQFIVANRDREVPGCGYDVEDDRAETEQGIGMKGKVTRQMVGRDPHQDARLSMHHVQRH